ncbi:MAG: alkylphosphonate utilization protein [Ferrovum sp. 37-45-19]|uniref:zinc ribbon domain-containing protein YjdM n=1 Tax=Ferrovum sp. JA12 TaxID=1356299 RepID=UPI0009E69FB8|nr:MAG: alkylphosphonate utilization protein [Ferrovum sp. 21-44-67]OYV93947.1 MAG: alkylphosphonate utilization protein [Ferrovum sp. 37-45-19]
MMSLPPCPICNSQYTYENKGIFICPECAHEWTQGHSDTVDSIIIVRDAVGNILKDGDTITVMKDLKIKGSSQVVKVGTKVKNIRLVEGDHDIDCKIEGIGPMGLKSIFVKKA